MVVGAVSGHGHAGGHVRVLDQLPEVGKIHVCAATELAEVEKLAPPNRPRWPRNPPIWTDSWPETTWTR